MSSVANVTINIIARNGGEEAGLAKVLKRELEAVEFSTFDTIPVTLIIDTEDGWTEKAYEVPAAVAMEGSLRYWLMISASYLIM